jgi:hypothetical protein
VNSWEEEEDVAPPVISGSNSRRRNRKTTQEEESEELGGGSNCTRCRGRSGGCCECIEEFDDVHCAIEEVHEKVCDIQDS